jgi:N-methylhydantoinase B
LKPAAATSWIPPLSPLAWARDADEQYVCVGAVPAALRGGASPRAEVDPITFAVIGGALFAICEEMDLTLRNSSLSPIINLGKDFSCALFTSDAQLVAQACNCPGHVGSMHFALMACIDRFPRDEMRPGDVFVLNDPYRGGTHLPDITLITPVFLDDELVMFAGNRAHHSDVGGSVPGSFPLSSEIYEEGIRIPPARLVAGGTRIDQVSEILLANVRTPREVEGDLDAQIAANDAGARGVVRLLDRYGRDVVLAAIEEYLDHSERALRESLRVPDGTYSASDRIDGNGDDDRPLEITASLTFRDGDVFVDFAGTHAQSRGPVNSVFPVTVSMVVSALLSLTDPTIMPNHGFYRPIHVTAPAGSLVNPRFPAPAVGFPDVCNRIVDVIIAALAPVIPERVIAATSGTTCNTFLGGRHPITDEPYVWYSINSQGGWGGRAGADGWHNVCFIEANGWDIPVETIEYRYPWRVLAYRLREDSAGAGRWRGGEGNHLELTPIGHDAIFSLNGDRASTPPFGLFGGKPGATARCQIRRRDGTVEQIAPRTMKAERLAVREGDVLVIDATSGAGFGNPLERDPHEVLEDVLDGILSRERARTQYGVVVDAVTGALDEGATNGLRVELGRAYAETAPSLPPVDRRGYELPPPAAT